MGKYADEQAIKLRQDALNEQDPVRRDELLREAEKWDEGGAYRFAMHTMLGGLSGGVGGAAGAAASAAGMPIIGEQIADLNLPEPVRQAITQAAGLAAGALAGAGVGAAAALNETAHNYVTHSPFANVRRTVSMENARLTNEVIATCGADTACMAQGFKDNDLQLQRLETAGNLAHIAQHSTLTTEQAVLFGETAALLLPVYGTPLALYQAISGESPTGRELGAAERFFSGLAGAAGVGSTAYAFFNRLARGAAEEAGVAGRGTAAAAGATPVTSGGTANSATGAKLAEQLSDESLTASGANMNNIKVVAEGKVNGQVYIDTNQTARPVTAANASEITLVPPDRVAAREAQGLGNVNGNMATAHAEVGVIQQASNAGVAKGADMTLTVKGENVCDFCRGDIPAAAQAAGLKSLVIVDEAAGVTYYWLPGMTRLKPR